MQRLLIVVPYRDRETHLKSFVPHLRAYFARDKLDRHIPYRGIIVEQDARGPFNRGALKNVGFALGVGDSEYTCFHDIDYLPIWADYSYADVPTPIVWYGAETRPIAPEKTHRVIIHQMENFFGAAVLIPNTLFTEVNGYSNQYWGWGYEDEDLKRRFLAAGMSLGRRRGTFAALDHDNEGFALDGAPTRINFQNKQRMLDRWTNASKSIDGLSTLKYEVISRKAISDPVPEREALWEIVKVQLKMPIPEQV